jgi:hypothetical protein
MDDVSQMDAFRRSSKDKGNLNLHLVSNVKLFPTHMDLEFGIRGIAKKLVKDVVYLWRRNFEKTKFLLPTS